MGPSEEANALDYVPVGQEEQIKKLIEGGTCPQPGCNGRMVEVLPKDDFIMLRCIECDFEVPKKNELLEAFKELPQDIWVVGDTYGNELWMAEGFFDTEQEAIDNAKENEFVAKMPFGERLAENVRDIECIYWPHRETKEEGMAKLEELRKEPTPPSIELIKEGPAEPTGCSGCTPAIIDGQLVHEVGCRWLGAPVGGGLGIVDTGATKKKKKKDEPTTPEGYGEIKKGMEGVLNGVPVIVRKVTKKDIIMRPLNRTIRDKDGMIVSFKERK